MILVLFILLITVNMIKLVIICNKQMFMTAISIMQKCAELFAATDSV